MTVNQKIRLTECPRDAMQGIKTYIPVEAKAKYLNNLLKVGFDILDFGSFVSPKAIPQLKDTIQVLEKLEMEHTNTKLLGIVGNLRGAKQAAEFESISYLGFPFSISDTFLQRNINSNVESAFALCNELLELCDTKGKKLMIYISMAFGNTYGDAWNVDILQDWVFKLMQKGATEINLADTVGVATPETIDEVFKTMIPEFPGMNLGFHLHAKPTEWFDKIDAAFRHGCRNFDGVLSGKGGCPMSGGKMVENLHMKNLIDYLDTHNMVTNLDRQALDKAFNQAVEIMGNIE